MAPLIALFTGTLLARLAGLLGADPLDAWPAAVRVGLALMFLVTGIAHFHPKLRGDMVNMVPPRLPRPELLVTATGVLEIAGAVGVLVPPTARLAAACLGLLLIAMFPANVSAALRRIEFGGRPATPLVRRSIEQCVYLAAVVVALF